MTFFDGILTISVIFLFGGFLSLVYQRQNGHIGAAAPEPTVLRQLEACGHQLATAQQAVEVWQSVALKYKARIAELSLALENCEQTSK